ncbi:hypothetical protein HMSSN036_38560 [Paenibacillus macerans]|nr:hypothetical protein HMSSN036_38560 [Paenibacillus macerans]
MAHQHRFDQIPVLQLEQKLDRAVDGFLPGMFFQLFDRKMLGKHRPALGVYIVHRLKSVTRCRYSQSQTRSARPFLCP